MDHPTTMTREVDAQFKPAHGSDDSKPAHEKDYFTLGLPGGAQGLLMTSLVAYYWLLSSISVFQILFLWWTAEDNPDCDYTAEYFHFSLLSTTNVLVLLTRVEKKQAEVAFWFSSICNFPMNCGFLIFILRSKENAAECSSGLVRIGMACSTIATLLLFLILWGIQFKRYDERPLDPVDDPETGLLLAHTCSASFACANETKMDPHPTIVSVGDRSLKTRCSSVPSIYKAGH